MGLQCRMGMSESLLTLKKLVADLKDVTSPAKHGCHYLIYVAPLQHSFFPASLLDEPTTQNKGKKRTRTTETELLRRAFRINTDPRDDLLSFNGDIPQPSFSAKGPIPHIWITNGKVLGKKWYSSHPHTTCFTA